MERKSGHNQAEVDRILKEAEDRKNAAEADPTPPVSREEAIAAIKEAGAGAVEEHDNRYKDDLEKNKE